MHPEPLGFGAMASVPSCFLSEFELTCRAALLLEGNTPELHVIQGDSIQSIRESPTQNTLPLRAMLCYHMINASRATP